MQGREVAVSNDKKYPPNVRLREAREDREWSQEQLAEMVGRKTSQVTVSRWENGDSFPYPNTRQKLCKLFGKTLDELGLIPPPDDIEPEADKSVPPPPSEEEKRVWNLPSMRNPLFTGREPLLEKLHRRLATGRAAALVQPQALYGLGGIGKTQTASEYAYRYGNEYSHVCWVSAANRETLVADYVALAGLIGLPEKGGQDQQQIVAAVKRWLAAQENWLLVMDNADDLLLAQEFLPPGHHGYVLYTTRAQAAGTIAASIEVEKLSVAEGMVLLLRWSKRMEVDETLEEVRAEDRDAAEQIVREMDGLPLALVQAGAYVEETGCSLTEYLQLYGKHRTYMLARRSRLMAGYPETVATTWSLSFQLVEQENPAAADILRICAFLAADAIPEALLLEGAGALGELPGTEVRDMLTLNDVLEVLRRYSLVKRETDTHMLSIHRLVQAVLRDSLDEQGQRLWAERTVRVVNAAFPKENYGANPQYQYYLPHVQECAALIEQYHLHFAEAAQLLYNAGAYQYYYGFHPQAQTFHEQALAIREEVSGPEHPVVAESLNALGILARNQGNYEQAERFHRQALHIREKALGAHHPTTAVSLNNLSVLYRGQGKYEQAEPFLQKALSIRKQLLGHDHADTLITVLNLANLYIEQQKYEQAEPLLQQVLGIGEQAQRPDNLLIAHTLNLLARLYYEQKKYEHSEPLWKRALSILEKTLGSEHPATAERLNDLAELFFVQGNIAQAQSLCQKAVSICEKTLGLEHPDTVAYRRHLAQITAKREEEQDGDNHCHPAPL